MPKKHSREEKRGYRFTLIVTSSGLILKSDKSLSNKQVAYVMGHQATSSIEQYGHVKSGTGSAGIEPTISKEDINKLVRDTVKPMNEAAMRPIKDSNTEYSPNIPSMKM